MFSQNFLFFFWITRNNKQGKEIHVYMWEKIEVFFSPLFLCFFNNLLVLLFEILNQKKISSSIINTHTHTPTHTYISHSSSPVLCCRDVSFNICFHQIFLSFVDFINIKLRRHICWQISIIVREEKNDLNHTSVYIKKKKRICFLNSNCTLPLVYLIHPSNWRDEINAHLFDDLFFQ